jgi:NodT family efflux transporter outer membrane factor (OMF) lipoprotein
MREIFPLIDRLVNIRQRAAMWRWPAMVIAASLLGACATTAPPGDPAVPVPAAFSTGPQGSSPEGDWWATFDDPVLSGLTDRALGSSPDTAAAAARVRQAREQLRIVQAGRGPQLKASGQASAARLSENALPSSLAGALSGGSGPSGGIGLPGETFNTYQAGFDAAWEIDLFGGQRSDERAATARADAATWSARDARVMLAAEVARTYEQYRALQRRLAIADETLALQRETLDFMQVRARHGLVVQSEVRGQERALDQSGVQRADLAAEAQVAVHALSTLLGEPPTALAEELASPPPPAPGLVDIPPGLPSQLLRRRPDIRVAERQLAAATSDIDVATADLYPRISLTGALQLASRPLTSLLETNSLQTNVAARISAPLLDRGRLRANVRLSQARTDELAAAYARTVLLALRDVEDGLTRLDADRRKLAQLQAAVAAARDEAEEASVRYRNGLDPAPVMLAARLTSQAARDAQAQGEAAAAQDMIALYKALGGGWDQARAPTDEDRSGGQLQ